MTDASPRPDDDAARPEDLDGGSPTTDGTEQAGDGAAGTADEAPVGTQDETPVETPNEAPDGPAPQPAAESAEDSQPTLARLLTRTARGDQAAFAQFYEATADVVYGLALLMHEDVDGAQTAMVAVYHHLWDQADERARDLRLQSAAAESLADHVAAQEEGPDSDEPAYRPEEHELVLEWLIPLAHRIMVERFREGAVRPIELTVVDSGGVAGLPEEVLEDFAPLSDSQIQVLALCYLSGMNHHEAAAQVNSALPAVKSRLRDAMTRLHTVRSGRVDVDDPILRAAVTRRDLERGAGVNRNFSDRIDTDLRRELLVELSEVYAMDAVDDRERSLLDEEALNASESVAQRWDTRVLAARRTLAEIFTSHPVDPPRHLLEEMMLDLSDQEVGMTMVEEVSTHTEEGPKRQPVVKRWMVVTGLIVVVVLAAVMIWRLTIGQDVQERVDEADDVASSDEVEMAEGGTAQLVVSEEEDLGYAEFDEVAPVDGMTYQVWLLPDGEGQPSSLGSFSAEELSEETVELRGIGTYDRLSVTAEEIAGAERPTGEVVVEIPLSTEASSGPTYGGPTGG
ncbi:MAG: anti-sigma factor [Nesterenkonia sp.]|nr:anti-sigma factor [Nesterenkonia sp.]